MTISAAEIRLSRVGKDPSDMHGCHEYLMGGKQRILCRVNMP